MDQYLGEIRLVGYTFAPVDWVFCNGQLLSIAQNDALYALLGTTYGGDGQTTFAVPNLCGRIPVSQGDYAGSSYALGQNGGQETVTLTSNQVPLHVHSINAQSGSATSNSPAGAFFASNANNQYQSLPANGVTGNMLGPIGGNQPHDNMMPFLALNYIIATAGIYPSSN